MPTNRYPIIAQETWPILSILLGLTLLSQLLIGPFAFIFSLSILLLTLYLFRDPQQVIPSSPLAVVSPVHGVVTLIEEAEEIRLKNKAKRIQITIGINDVYSLRSPIEGKVMQQWCSQPDEIESRRHFDFHIRSDEGDDIVTAIRLKDIIRRFHVYIHTGERIGQGQRCGYLYFGGVVDIFLPMDCKIQVEEGQHVSSGSTVIGQLIHANGTSAIPQSA